MLVRCIGERRVEVFALAADALQHGIGELQLGPGADATQIRLEYAGATEIQVSDDERSLIVRTSLGEVREGALSCYQGDPSHPIGARFQLEGNAVSVVVDSYDRSRPLVREVGYIPLLDAVYDLAVTRVEKRVTGSVFGGKGSQVGVSLESLLAAEAK